jgi:unsaturated rhamnogalacturonyl hydrolase
MYNYSKIIFHFFCLLLLFSVSGSAQNQTQILGLKSENSIADTLKWSERMALSIMKRHPKAWQIDNNEKPKWEYKPSFMLLSIQKLYNQTNKSKYNDYIKEYADTFIDSSGSISHYELKDYNLDLVNPGKLLFDLYKDTQDSRYLKAMQLLKKQIEGQPRTTSGGFWHKKIYPNQMWLDGLYMESPFYTRYTITFEEGKGLNDIANQFELIHEHSFDKKTGLPYHAWDESKSIGWANKETGTSPTIWSRSVGWYTMALVDVLDYFPKDHPKYNELVSYLNEVAIAIAKKQDPSGLWFQVADAGTKEGNFLETSSSSMFAYAFAKGVNKGYLSKKYKKLANKVFTGVVKDFIKVDQNGEVHLEQISFSAGLGGTPFRDGSYKQYTDGKKSVDNSIGVGAFILAAIELNK